MTKEQIAELNTMASELKNTLHILKALLLNYGDDYAVPIDETIIANIQQRPGVISLMFAAVEDYANQARAQAEELEEVTGQYMTEAYKAAS